MNIIDVYIGRDFYDYARSPSHHVSETNVDDEYIDAVLERTVKEFKAKKIPWYVMTVTTYEVGGDVNTAHYHNAHPMKEKIILNKPAKDAPPRYGINIEELINGHHGLAVNVFAPPEAQQLEEEPDFD
jgi:lysozyme family protein